MNSLAVIQREGTRSPFSQIASTRRRSAPDRTVVLIITEDKNNIDKISQSLARGSSKKYKVYAIDSPYDAGVIAERSGADIVISDIFFHKKKCDFMVALSRVQRRVRDFSTILIENKDTDRALSRDSYLFSSIKKDDIPTRDLKNIIYK